MPSPHHHIIYGLWCEWKTNYLNLHEHVQKMKNENKLYIICIKRENQFGRDRFSNFKWRNVNQRKNKYFIKKKWFISILFSVANREIWFDFSSIAKTKNIKVGSNKQKIEQKSACRRAIFNILKIMAAPKVLKMVVC